MADSDQQASENLIALKAIEKLQNIAKDARTSMLHTSLSDFPHSCRPMSLQTADDEGNLYYLSSSDGSQNAEIAKDSRVQVTFQNNSSFEYLVVHGHATIIKDQATIDKYWTSFANAWFDGKQDPRVTVIKVTPDGGYYWDTQNGKIISSMKMLFSALTGADVGDGGVSGRLKL